MSQQQQQHHLITADRKRQRLHSFGQVEPNGYDATSDNSHFHASMDGFRARSQSTSSLYANYPASFSSSGSGARESGVGGSGSGGMRGIEALMEVEHPGYNMASSTNAMDALGVFHSAGFDASRSGDVHQSIAGVAAKQEVPPNQLYATSGPLKLSQTGSVGGGLPAQDRKKQTQACDRCRVRKRKCDASRPFCGNCIKGEAEPLLTCTYTIQSKKRGPKRGYKEELMERMASIEALVRTGGANAAGDAIAALNGMAGAFAGRSGGGSGGASSSSTPTTSMGTSSLSAGIGLEMQQQQNPQSQSVTYDRRRSSSSTSLLVDPRSSRSLNYTPNQLVTGDRDDFAPISNASLFGGGTGTSIVGAGTSLVDTTGLHSNLPLDPTGLLGDGSDFVFDFGESLYSFQSIIGQSFLPAVNWENSDSLSKFLDELASPSLPSVIAKTSSNDSDKAPSVLPSPKPLGTPVGSVQATPTATSRAAPPSDHALSSLEEHLVHLYFAFLSTKIFMFHEPSFFASLYPQNRHPSHLIYSICAISCLFSDHPSIVDFGTTRNCCAEFTTKAAKELDQFEGVGEFDLDSVAAVQTLLLLSLIEYSFNQPVKAYRKLVAAIQMAVRLKLDQEDPNVAMNPLSIWPDKTIFYSPEKLMVRRKVWEFCLYFDTCIGLAGGLPLVIYEGAYMYLLSPPKCLEFEARLDAMDVSKLDDKERAKFQKIKGHLERDRLKTEDGLKRFLHCVRNPPQDTVFSALNMPVRPRPEEVYDNKYHLVMNQLSFILHRVIRLNYTVRTSGKKAGAPSSGHPSSSPSTDANPGLIIVMSIIPLPQDVVAIHDALIDFYHVLPPEYKPFLSLAQFFPIYPTYSGEDKHPVFAPQYDRTPIHTICIVTNFLSALVTLHLPRTDDTRSIFKIDSGMGGSAGRRVTSAEMVFLARKGMVFLVRGLLPRMTEDATSAGGGSIVGEDASIDSPSRPASRASQAVRDFGDSLSSLVAAAAYADETDSNAAGSSLSLHEGGNGVAPTFATRADETVQGIVHMQKSQVEEVDELARRSRMPLTSLVLEEPGGSVTALQHETDATGVNISALCDPIVGFHLFSIAVSSIAVSLSAGGTTGEAADMHRGLLTNLERSIETVDVPVIDCITYIFPICGSLSERLKRILLLVKKKLGK